MYSCRRTARFPVVLFACAYVTDILAKVGKTYLRLRGYTVLLINRPYRDSIYIESPHLTGQVN